MTTRQALREMIEEIPDGLLGVAGESLDRLRHWKNDPVLLSLAGAPVDDEPTTPEDLTAIERGRASARTGQGMSDDELDALLARE